MSQWVINGIRTGIKTTAYPNAQETAAGVTPGLPSAGEFPSSGIASLVERCPTGVFVEQAGRLTVNSRNCVHCFRCMRKTDQTAPWKSTYEWGSARLDEHEFAEPFKRSMHICVIDAGDCGACLNEVKQLNNPYYNMHRLGFFITPTPRHADLLLVVGPVTDHMKVALEKIYNAMPTPKKVVAVGACALTGGVFAGSFVCAKGVADVLPVDVEVPGNPPPPLAILHGLLVAAGRKPPIASEP